MALGLGVHIQYSVPPITPETEWGWGGEHRPNSDRTPIPLDWSQHLSVVPAALSRPGKHPWLGV